MHRYINNTLRRSNKQICSLLSCTTVVDKLSIEANWAWINHWKDGFYMQHRLAINTSPLCLDTNERKREREVWAKWQRLVCTLYSSTTMLLVHIDRHCRHPRHYMIRPYSLIVVQCKMSTQKKKKRLSFWEASGDAVQSDFSSSRQSRESLPCFLAASSLWWSQMSRRS